MSLATVRQYLDRQFNMFSTSDFFSRKELMGALLTYFYWVVPGFLFVITVEWLARFRSTAYLKKAIEQGVSPELWNVIGCFGAVLFGLSLLLPKWRFAAKAAKQVLANTFAIGSLSFGLILGQIFVELGSTNLAIWKWWFFGIGFGILLLMVTVLNFFTWYISSLAGQDTLLEKWSRVDLIARILTAAIISSAPILFLLSER